MKVTLDISQLLIWFLPVYFIAFFGVCFVWKSLVVARSIGKSPLVLPTDDDSAFGLVGRYFKYIMTAMFVYVMAWALVPSLRESMRVEVFSWFLGINQWVGCLILIAAFVWVWVAQGHMRNAWRIGIDHDTPTELVTDGLFAYSRNPIFLGMALSLLGLFLCTPNGFTLLFLVLGMVLMQVQIRLEEVHLVAMHGDAYRSYQKTVGRWI